MEEVNVSEQLDLTRLQEMMELLKDEEMKNDEETVLRRRRGVTFSENVQSHSDSGEESSSPPVQLAEAMEQNERKKSKSRTPSFTSAELDRIVTDVKMKAEEIFERTGAFVGKANEFACNYWNEASEQAGDIARYVKEGAEAAGDFAGDVVQSTREHAKDLVTKVIETSEHTVESVVETAKMVWEHCDFKSLPEWLQDNDYLHLGHRPPLPSFKECFRSIFRIHTETGNIWTHLIGCLMFIAVMAYFWVRTDFGFDTQEKIVFTVFFTGAIGCLGLSFTFHTVSCHSETVGKLFSKLDYVGITLLIVGSFVPWLYYGFYCEYLTYIIYLSVVVTLGIASMIVSLWDKFSEPEFRSIRAGVFICFGLTGVVPAVHHAVSMGWLNSVYQASLGWIILTGCLYIFGAVLYALRIPERFFPGKCDIWFHSHQIFHVLVICAAFVHYHGISEMAVYRLSVGECVTEVVLE